MQLEFWIDPICPWCWVTSRWVTDIAPHRDVEVNWRPISLLLKNGIGPESPWYEPAAATHGLLRVMESVRAAEGHAPLGGLYTVFGEHIHHRGERTVDAAALLAEAGLDTAHAAAATDESWDAVIRASMDDGLSLTGNDVGTPILGFVTPAGKRVGFFGPVITRRPPLDDALRLWDGLTMMAGVDGFWELKRTRTEDPDFTAPA
jgi:2-hydroxychromene-2-carboxylate isomerase